MKKVNILQKLSMIEDYWNPRITGELNGQYVKLVRFEGEFDWHHHENEDEMFLTISGSFRLETRDESFVVDAGEFIIVPRGVEHRPVADEPCSVMLFEPATTLNTGNVQTDKTRENLEMI